MRSLDYFFAKEESGENQVNGITKILNLYAGVGGNRKLWDNVDVTAVEINESVAEIYKDFFPEDQVLITDAHKFLEKNYQKYDFIWSSPPCPTHSRVRLMGSKNNSYPPKFPEMRLYEEVIFLQSYFNGKYCVENVTSFYDPLIKPQIVDRHFFWANFPIPKISLPYYGDIKKGHCKELQKVKGVNLDSYKLNGRRKDSLLRSYIHPKLGLHILNCARGIQKKLLEVSRAK